MWLLVKETCSSTLEALLEREGKANGVIWHKALGGEWILTLSLCHFCVNFTLGAAVPCWPLGLAVMHHVFCPWKSVTGKFVLIWFPHFKAAASLASESFPMDWKCSLTSYYDLRVKVSVSVGQPFLLGCCKSHSVRENAYYWWQPALIFLSLTADSAVHRGDPS